MAMLKIKEFDINELRAKLGKTLHGMKVVNFYSGDDRCKVPNIQVHGRMKIDEGKFGRYSEIDIDEKSKEFFKLLEEMLSRLAGVHLNEKPWNLKSFMVRYRSTYSIRCNIYSGCKQINVKFGKYFYGHCEIRPYHAFLKKLRRDPLKPQKISEIKGITLAANKVEW